MQPHSRPHSLPYDTFPFHPLQAVQKAKTHHAPPTLGRRYGIGKHTGIPRLSNALQ